MDFRARQLLKNILKKCRQFSLDFDLDHEWLASRLKHGHCELTGLPFNMSVATRKRNAFTPSVDRIQAGAGYTKQNCRLVLFSVNAAISDWGLEVLEQVANALIAKRKADVAVAA